MGKASKLEIMTLGGLTILLDGEPVQGLASRKAEALLVYLAVTGRPHEREHLATMLWDDRPLGRSLANLSVLLNSLKKQLGPFLQIERQTIAMRSESRVSVDLDGLDEVADSWDTIAQPKGKKHPPDLAHFEDVLATYKGDFLQGFHLREARGFDEWALLERERIQRQVQSYLRQLIAVYQRDGDLASSIRNLYRGLSLDPLEEELQRMLMRSLALSGRTAAAIAQYQDCAALLKTELQVEPSLATRRLYDRILARRERPPDNLPALMSSTIGREAEISEIQHSLLDPRTRLLTLVGAGGIGKTRLALEASKILKGAFLEGLWFVDLAPLEDPALVAQSIGRVLAMPDGPARESAENPSEVILSRLIEFLADKELLLILDNCEHLLGECVHISEKLLLRCPELKILVTSRERLDLAAEQIFLVEPLGVPIYPSDEIIKVDELRLNDSIRLFEERARAIRAQFALDERNAETLVRICTVLDGMPLAIELAASRLHTISLVQMAANLEQSLQSMVRDHTILDPRHQTLEAAIDWSYHLLTVEDQQQFRLATVFRGGFTQDAFIDVSRALGFEPQTAEASLAHLVEKSLVHLRELDTQELRYMLLEPVRQFGRKQMKADPFFENAQDAHADFFLNLAEEIGPELHGVDRKQYLHQLEMDADNVRAALRRQLQCERSEECLRFAHALWEGYWLNQGYFTEGRDWVDQILAISHPSKGNRYGSVRLARGAFAWTLGNIDESVEHILLALEHAERVGDARLLQWTYYWKASVIFDRSEFSAAQEALEQAYDYAMQAGEARGAAWAIFYQGQIARVKGQTDRAIRLYQDALEVLSELDLFGAGWCYIYLGHLATEKGDLALARDHLKQSLEIYTDLDNPRGLGGTERGLGLVELEEGNFEAAENHFRRSRFFFEKLGWIKMSSSSKIFLGFIAAITGRVEEASELLIESLAYQTREQDEHSIAHVLFVLGLLAMIMGEDEVAGSILSIAGKMQTELAVSFPPHLTSAVEDCQKTLAGKGIAVSDIGFTWQESVHAILGQPDAWLRSFHEALLG